MKNVILRLDIQLVCSRFNLNIKSQDDIFRSVFYHLLSQTDSQNVHLKKPKQKSVAMQVLLILHFKLGRLWTQEHTNVIWGVFSLDNLGMPILGLNSSFFPCRCHSSLSGINRILFRLSFSWQQNRRNMQQHS